MSADVGSVIRRIGTKPYKVLVLGAGASFAYGYPLGGKLRAEILKISVADAKDAGIVRERTERADIRLLTEFIEDFRHSQMYSIDAFLGRRQSYSDIGKKCIAQVLLTCELSTELFSEYSDKDHWYQYFWNQLLSADGADVDFSGLAIITFNYDRSFEHYLLVTLQSACGMKREEAYRKLKELRILHVYGSIGETNPGHTGYIKYDGKIDIEKVESAAANIEVIPEGRSNSPTLVEARDLLLKADGIAFLGFGYDQTNVERLAEDGACELRVKRAGSVKYRRLLGTCWGMKEAEIARAYFGLTNKEYQAGVQPGPLYNLNCTEFLRTTLFLDR